MNAGTTTTAPSEEGQPGQPGATDVSGEVVDALLLLMDHRDSATASHCREVGALASRLADQTFSHADRLDLETAGKLHDIGKLAMSDKVLCKPSTLGPVEWESVRQCFWWGLHLVSGVLRCPRISAILYGHASWLGRSSDAPGPGQELQGTCATSVRILVVADAYSAMTAPRPYRRARTVEEALQELHCSPRRFDTAVVNRLEKQITGTSRTEAADSTKPVGWRLRYQRALREIADTLADWDIARLESVLTRLGNSLDDTVPPEVADLTNQVHAAITSEGDPYKAVLLAGQIDELVSPPAA